MLARVFCAAGEVSPRLLRTLAEVVLWPVQLIDISPVVLATVRLADCHMGMRLLKRRVRLAKRFVIEINSMATHPPMD